MNYPDTPRTEAQKILVEGGHFLGTKIYGTNGRPGDVFEGRVVQEVSAGNYAALVYEDGTIDTNHTLYLVNTAEGVHAQLASTLVQTPSCYWEGINIVSLEEQDGCALIKWTCRKEAKEGKFSLKAEVKTEQTVVAKLKRITGIKYLFVDDNGEWLRSVARAFGDNPSVAFAECHSVNDAMRAIAEHAPEVIFLDHQLTEDGAEGFEIANRVTDAKIYTTTSYFDALAEYQKRGIEKVGKTDLKRYRSIIG